MSDRLIDTLPADVRQRIKKEMEQDSKIETAAAKLLDGVSPLFWKKLRLPDNEDDLPDFVEQVKADYQNLNPGYINEPKGGLHPDIVKYGNNLSQKVNKPNSTGIDPEIIKYCKTLNQQAGQQIKK